MKFLTAKTLLLSITLLCSLAGAANAQTGTPMQVFTSVLPLKYFVERVGGQRVAVQVMVGPGRSPATYEPKPKQMTALSQAQLYYRIGVPFEKVWMKRVATLNPAMEIIDLRQGLELRSLEHHHHHHTEEDQHEIERKAPAKEEEKDPHLWTDPNLVKQMAERIRVTLTAVDPAGAEDYQAGADSFTRDLDNLDRTIRRQLMNLKKRSFLVFHPSWGYFAAAYDLQQVAVEASGKEPGPRALADIIQQAKDNHISVIFVQQQFSRTTAATIARAIDGRVVAIDPLAEDYLANMRRTAEAFARSLEISL
ncbi:metal ABC transporter solute-binding protein, Zn/Mn family [Syntrophotalea acetylenivorans]|nr:zinc ABC transporter substrate-binding protein [Syntrophotalea acetylenivorans]